MRLVGFTGSLRKASYNRTLLRTLGELLPEGASLEILDPGVLPLFNQDLEKDFPATAKDFKEKIRGANGVIIATPEFNRSIPGVLKNAIDWTSRPYGDNVFQGKKVLVLGASGGNVSTALAQYDLKKILLYLDARMMGQPEVMIGNILGKLDASGALTDAPTRDFLRGAIKKFVAFVKTT
ncbi:MAG: NAD(P)H-dependent oxidoreductase [Patescibacteria group bacterium]|nr:NAD(P)H-dependent oxidoreductase [Patescibacteria group bacterium]